MSLFGKKEREIIDAQEATIQSLNKKLEDLGYSEFTQVKAAIDSGKKEIEKNNAIIGQLSSRIETLSADASKLEKQANSAQNKLKRSRELYKSIEYSITEFNNPYSDGRVPLLTPEDRTSLDELAPSPESSPFPTNPITASTRVTAKNTATAAIARLINLP